MSGTVKSKPLTKAYVEGWERSHGPVQYDEPNPLRTVRPHDCEHCGHHMEYDDQQCACMARSLW